jgi:ATP-dependent exoDNAse (exonuclease V) beta subunit
MTPMGNMMILASAGSGKTYALTNRYVGLLAAGARPERIAALTFTRKAAGEFFDEILKKLARAAGDATYAAKIAGEIGRPDLAPPDFTRLLRAVIDGMHRLCLGTLDGFFARVVRAFPLELGLGGDFEIMQEHAARIERLRVLRQMFAHTGGAPTAAQRDFIESFKRATFGLEEKRLGPRLDTFLDDHAEIYLAAPDGALWGRPARIWPSGCRWLDAGGDRAGAARRLHGVLPWAALSEGQRGRWEKFFAELPLWQAGATLPEGLSYILGNVFKVWPELAEVLVDRRKLALAPAAASALAELATAIVGAEFTRRLEVTRGIFEVLGRYDAVYDQAVRRAGKLTFADLQRLLRPDVPGGSRVLSRQAADEARLFIDWRLDSQIDHWLLDEFQDTSFGQWSVLRNLVDEAVQDPSGTRSFFYVGDVKQAIFAWREGDSRLFREIFNHYNAAAPGVIEEDSRVRSFRSGRAVISTVNRVLGDAAVLRRLFPPAAAARWSAEWRDHESEPSLPEGYAELIVADDGPARFAATLGIIARVKPLERRLGVAILVQQNETATALADYLRREGRLPAVAESDLHVGVDNPLTCSILALFRAAAHPGDRAAAVHLRMTPLHGVLAAAGLGAADALTSRVLAQIHARGFERTVEAWLRVLEPHLGPGDAFSRERGRQLSAAARVFDSSGSRDVAEFVAFMESYAVRDTDTSAVIRVMTVHKAKGLGFDVVILPDLEGRTLAGRRRGLAVQKAADRSVQWVMQLPNRKFAELDPVLASHVDAAESDACYENLCLLYVAMTRAKKAMYLITGEVGDSSSANFPRLLRETIGGRRAEGDPLWFENLPVGPAEPGAGEGAAAPDFGRLARAARRQRRRPSDESRGPAGTAAALFSLEARASAEFGSAVHRLLADVEWGDADATRILAAAWPERGPEGAEALACLRAPELAGVWSRPSAPGEVGEVLRERAFEIVIDGSWVSGVFDRVVVVRDAAGGAVRATVFDFKTDRVAGESEVGTLRERHAGQLKLYRQAASLLTGIPLERVACELVLTGPRRRVPL